MEAKLTTIFCGIIAFGIFEIFLFIVNMQLTTPKTNDCCVDVSNEKFVEILFLDEGIGHLVVNTRRLRINVTDLPDGMLCINASNYTERWNVLQVYSKNKNYGLLYVDNCKGV
ncbi:MAG: hypothetical protein ACTSUF_09740 [Candidatus Heimdallarchaeaceae archaeon]